jgi:hypothetical protein
MRALRSTATSTSILMSSCPSGFTRDKRLETKGHAMNSMDSLSLRPLRVTAMTASLSVLCAGFASAPPEDPPAAPASAAGTRKARADERSIGGRARVPCPADYVFQARAGTPELQRSTP